MTTLTHISELGNMDREGLIELMLVKDRRIQDLERLVEEQKRLRLQDSNQVEEKAAKIKEWVTNKLKELENQNKLLRDQNKKQKEAVESLSSKLATLSPISSPRKRNSNSSSNNNNKNNINNNSNSLDRVHYIDQHSVPSSPIHTIDVTKSLKTRRPQLKKVLLHQQRPNPLPDPDESHAEQSLRITLNSSTAHCAAAQQHGRVTPSGADALRGSSHINRNGGVSLVSIGESVSQQQAAGPRREPRQQQDSPLYDTVNIELVNSSDNQHKHEQQQQLSQTKTSSIHIVNSPRHNISQKNAQGNDVIINNNNHNNSNNLHQRHEEEAHYDKFHYQEEPAPPPPPMHQFDRWESELYNLAEATFSSLMHNSQELVGDSQEPERHAHSQNGDDTNKLRDAGKPGGPSLRDGIISVIKPSFTTIDGDRVVEGSREQPPGERAARQSLSELSERDSEFAGSLRRSCEQGREHEHKHAHVHAHELERRGSRDLLLGQMRSSASQNGRSLDLHTDKSAHCFYASQLHEPAMKQKSLDNQMFSSPMRLRSGKDSILRTQSVRRQPAPEKLYDFVAADLVKRGQLTKHGALRSHARWIVLKNFHLYSYKRESDETNHASPSMSLKLEPSFQIQVTSQSSDGYPFKLIHSTGGAGAAATTGTGAAKSLLLIAETAQARDEWCQILTVAISMSDIEPERLTKSNSQHEGMLAMARHGHTKRCHAVLVKHVIFFLKSPVDPTPVGYISVKGAKIREVMDNQDYDLEEQEAHLRQGEGGRDCSSLAVYPRYSLNPDPVYLTLGSQQDTDEWFHQLSGASGLDQSSGTEFERILTQTMLDRCSLAGRKSSVASLADSLASRQSHCMWREHGSIMIYTDKPLSQPLTSLPNETLRTEATELFKSILLFTQVPLEPVAIDYHVCLLQNCLTRFLKHPELRNEFFAQLIKQSTYVLHHCGSRSKLSSISSSGGGSSGTQRSSDSSLSPTASECHFVTDLHSLESVCLSKQAFGNGNKACSTGSQSAAHQHSQRGRSNTMSPAGFPSDEPNLPAPSPSELLQVMQIIAIAVSVNLPRGRLRWWLVQHLQKFANSSTEVGKYALYSLRAIERTAENGCRDNIPSRTELLGILLRNPYDHSTPHSLPVSFADGTYLVVGADGSTTVEEFMLELGKSVNVRASPQSDFYLFANDPGAGRDGASRPDLHILEPHRKVLDVVGWWEQSFKQNNIGRQQNTRVIKLVCKKRLVLQVEEGETDQERALIVSQVNKEIVGYKIPLSEPLVVELAALMTQFTFGDCEKSTRDMSALNRVQEHIIGNFIPSDGGEVCKNGSLEQNQKLVGQVLDHWQKLSGRTAQDCVRVYLNCIRRLRLSGP